MSKSDTRLHHYVIRGGEDGIRRLRIIAEVLWPTTHALLGRAGIREGMACLDLGCGPGEATMAIAGLVGRSGKVVGVELEAAKVEAAKGAASDRSVANVEFRIADVTEWDEALTYDLVYARFLLTHLRQPERMIGRMIRALRPGGVAVVEDVDFTGHFCYPPCESFDEYVQLYREVVRHRGGDADIGPKLAGLLMDGGFENVHVDVIQPVFMSGDGKFLAAKTFEFIIESLVAEGLEAEANLRTELAGLEDFTRDPRSLVSLPRIFQVWGNRPRG